MTDTATNDSTATKKTGETTPATHLDRLYGVLYLLAGLRGSARRVDNKGEVRRLSEQIESVRWTIEELSG